eukprot:TRINITY_DN12821_c1_g1_i3.p1 TRINITY_DN12821_c1_g1~~TRINITY_DN12821_c1_g1_i3.p1  ORF type:complete len:423 (+),score=68.02 TRINITY_DN12821_c1_g1_i3:94-1362(+)
MASARPLPGGSRGVKGPGGKAITCAQKIEQATVRKTHVTMGEGQARDAEVLFAKYDSEGTALLPRGSLTELLRDIGLEAVLGDSFSASTRLAFDAHSADSHFLSLNEFKQLYYTISSQHPQLLPRPTKLTISIINARGLPPADVNGKSDPYCTVVVPGKPYSKSCTRIIERTLDPKWDEEFDDKYGYVDEEDSLFFEVFDFDKGSDGELLGSATLESHEFYRAGGFDGKIQLTSEIKGYSPTLKVRVVANELPAPPPALKISIISAKGLPPADPNGKSDPFCVCQLIGKPYSKSSTKIKAKTLDPKWDEDFDDKYRYEEGDSILFELFDYDKGGKCDVLGKCVLEGSSFHKVGGFDGELQVIDTEKGYSPTLRVKVIVNDLENRAETELASPAGAPAPAGAAAAATSAPAGSPAAVPAAAAP